MPALSNFLGNDYIDRLDGNGPVAVRSLMGRFVDSQDDTEREMILEELEITKKWNRNDQRLAGGNFDIGKIQTAKCRIKSTGHEAIAIRKVPIPFGFAFQDDDAEKELKKERRRRERDNRNRQSNITSH